MKELLTESLLDAVLDTVKLLPFLFVTYVFMEWLEKKTYGRQADILRSSEKFGPFVGAMLGVVPQCGFSLMASNLYSGGVIGAGVLLSVFMSTSDEMLPIMLSNDSIAVSSVVKILLTKVVIAIITGYLAGMILDNKRNRTSAKRIEPGYIRKNSHKDINENDALSSGQDKIHAHNIVYNDISGHRDKTSGHVHDYRQEHSHDHGHSAEKNIHEMCEQEHCDCEAGVLRSAVNHTIKITIFILLFTFALNIVIGAASEDEVARIFSDIPVVGEAAAALVGLLPNCAASVMLTELYIQGMLSPGAMMSGLLVSAGVGLAVLFRMNRHRIGENARIAVVLYVSGVIWGVLINAVGISF